jgi:hypothetical protein
MGRARGHDQVSAGSIRRRGSRATTNSATLIRAGLLSAGEKLYVDVSSGDGERRTAVAVLDEGGEVLILSDGAHGRLKGSHFDSPSAAIAALYGRPDSAWMNWLVERDGAHVPLEAIRKMFEASLTDS